MKKLKMKFFSSVMAATMVVSMLMTPYGVYKVDAATVRYPYGEESSEPSEGYIYVEVNGSFAQDTVKDILDYVNAIRKQACEEGVPYPSLKDPSGKNLTMDDYHEVKWSESLQWKSQIRAVESNVSFSHDRPNGLDNGPTMPGADVSSFYETISSGSSSVIGAINQWYGEKNTYISSGGVFANNTGHYLALIDPKVEYIGMSVFNNRGAGEYSSSIYGHSANTSEKDISISGNMTHLVEVKNSKVSSVVFRENNKNITALTLTKGDIHDLNFCAYFSGYKKIHSGFTYESSEPGVATVSNNGVITAKSVGTTTITAKIDSTLKAELDVTVRAITSVDAPADITVESGDSPLSKLPEKVTANWSDNTTTKEIVTWGTISEDYKKREGGSFTVEGTVDNYAEKIVQRVVVNPATVTDYEVPEGIITESGTAPELPEKTEVSWSNGDISEESITWNKPVKEEYSARTGGTFDIGGVVEGNSFTTQYEVKPAYISSLDYDNEIETKECVAPDVPEKVEVNWSNGDNSEEVVQWDDIDEESYQNPNEEFQVTGTIKGYTGINKDVLITVNVIPKELTGIEIKNGTLTGTEFYDSYDWSKVEGVVTASYDNGTFDEISIQDVINNCDNDSKNTSQVVQLSYTYRGVTKQTEAELTLHLPDSLVIVPPDKLEYVEGQDLDIAGFSATTYYDDNTVKQYEEGTVNYSISGYDKSQIGKQTINVTQDGITESFEVNVIAKVATDIEITGILPQKVEKAFKTDDAKVEVTYNDGDIRQFELKDLCSDGSVTVEDYDSSVVGKQTIKLVYNDINNDYDSDIELNYDIEVKDKIVDNISITKLPDRIKYIEGLPLVLTGGKVQVFYDNDTNEIRDITEDIVSGYDNKVIGDQVVTVTIDGKTDTFDVNVRAKQIESVAFTGPTKTVYFEGQDFDPTGVSAVISYDNGTTDDATILFNADGESLVADALLYLDGVSVSENKLKAGSYTFKIGYKTYSSDDYDIEVKMPAKDVASEISGNIKESLATVDDTSSAEDIIAILEGKTIKVPCADNTSVEITLTEDIISSPVNLNAAEEDTLTDAEKKMVEEAKAEEKIIEKVAIEVSKDAEDNPVYTYVYLEINKKPESTPSPTSTPAATEAPTTAPLPTAEVSPTPEDIPTVEPSSEPYEPDDNNPKPGDRITVDGAKYEVTDEDTVIYVGPVYKNVTKVNVPAYVMIGNEDYPVTEIKSGAFNNCRKLKKVTIGENVTTVGDSAFYKCTSLTSIVIPKNVKTIGKKAFYGCKKLKKVTIKTTKLKKNTIGSKAFKGVYKKVSFKCPKSKVKNYKKWIKKAGAPKKAKYKK